MAARPSGRGSRSFRPASPAGARAPDSRIPIGNRMASRRMSPGVYRPRLGSKSIWPAGSSSAPVWVRFRSRARWAASTSTEKLPGPEGVLLGCPADAADGCGCPDASRSLRHRGSHFPRCGLTCGSIGGSQGHSAAVPGHSSCFCSWAITASRAASWRSRSFIRFCSLAMFASCAVGLRVGPAAPLREVVSAANDGTETHSRPMPDKAATNTFCDVTRPIPRPLNNLEVVVEPAPSISDFTQE